MISQAEIVSHKDRVVFLSLLRPHDDEPRVVIKVEDVNQRSTYDGFLM